VTAPCFNHSRADAVGVCINCGMTFCNDCLRQVGQEVACVKCAPAVARQMQMGVQSASQLPRPNLAYAPTAQDTSSSQSHSNPVQFMMGLLLSGVIGIVGCILIMKIYFYTGFGLSYLYILVGYGIGWGMWAINGKGGAKTFVATALIYVISIAIAHLVFAGDVLAKEQAVGRAESLTAAEAFLPVIQQLTILHWICVLIGFGSIWKAESRDGGR
jgi:hypothetical protein